MRKMLYLFVLASGLLLALPSQAKIQYQITISEPQHHLANIQMLVPQGKAQLDVMLPNWRTGNYQIINQANGVRDFTVEGGNGSSLNWTRIDKSHWRIENPSEQAVTIRYSLYANELGRRTRHIDSSHAYLDATATLMYVADLMGEVHQVKLNVNQNWKSYSGMVETSPNEFIAQSYHQLASSPIESGLSELHEFSVDDRNYQLVIWGKGNFNGDKMAEDLQKLAAASQKIWSGYPYNKYVFIVHATSGESGATEHLNSTVIQRPRFSFAPRKEYLKFLNTASHELIHTWNVKAYRPDGLVPYNYQAENYSDLLWVAEGSTSYFQGSLLLMAKLQTVKEFLNDLSDRINDYSNAPGHLQQSIAEASFEKWIAQNGDFADNHSVNIYSEGYMASWLLDFKMIKDSSLKANYKNLHRSMYNEIDLASDTYKQFMASPYSADKIKAIAKSLTKTDYDDWWQSNIDSPMEVDFEQMLNSAGLKFAELNEKDYKVETGFSSEQQQEAMILTKVKKHGPAWEAGLTSGDQLVAINSLKVTQENIKNRLEKYKPGEKVNVTIFRNEQLQTHSLVFGKTTKKPRRVELNKTASEEQKAFFKIWLGIDFPAVIEAVDPDAEEKE